MSKETLAEQLFKGIANAVSDVREKCVEEAYFGRVVNERGPEPEWPKAEEIQQGFGSHLQEREVGDIDR